MIALKNILVATDFSEPSGVALHYGSDLARQYGATLHVVHVIEHLPSLHDAEIGFNVVEIERSIEAATRKELDAALSADAGGTPAVQVAILRAAKAPHAIVEYAREHAVDLIIVGTHGRGMVSRFLMGSVAERVARTAPCPVLTVRAQERAAVDDGVAADRAHDPVHV